MRTSVVASITALALLSAAAGAAEDASARVTSRMHSFLQAVNNFDERAFSAHVDDSVTMFAPDMPDVASLNRLTGRAAVEGNFFHLFATLRKKLAGPPYLDIRPRDFLVQVGAGTAIVTFDLATADGGLGRRTFVFEKRASDWFIVHIHASNVAAAASRLTDRS